MDEIDLSEYFQVLSRRRALIVCMALLAVLAAAVALAFTPRVYRGRAVLLFPQSKQTNGLLSQLTGTVSLADLGMPVANGPGMYAEILKSRTLSEQVIKKLDLAKHGIDPDEFREQIDISITKDGGMEIACYVPTKWVEGSGNETKKKTAQLAAMVTNTFIESLKDFDREHALSSGHEKRVFLEGEVAKNKQDLTEAEDELRRFKESHPMLPPPETVSQQMEHVIALRTQQIEAETELGETGRSIEQTKNEIADQETILSASKVIQENPVVTEFKTQLAQAEVHKAQLLENFTENHPDVVLVDQEISKVKQRTREEIEKVVLSETLELNPVRQSLVQNLAALEITKSGLEARTNALQQVMRRIEGEFSDIAKDQMRYLRLMREVKALEGVYASLLAELSKAKVSEAKEPDGFTVLDQAVAEKYPIKPRVKLTLLGALIMGGIVGSFFAFVLEARHPKKRQALGNR